MVLFGIRFYIYVIMQSTAPLPTPTLQVLNMWQIFIMFRLYCSIFIVAHPSISKTDMWIICRLRRYFHALEAFQWSLLLCYAIKYSYF